MKGTFSFKQSFAFVVLTLLVGIIAYWPLQLYFLGDDFLHIPASTQELLLQRNSARPIGNLSLWVDAYLYHQQAWGYHCTNLVLHIANSFLVFVIVRQLERLLAATYKLSNWAVAVAALFFLYPFHSEAVFWIIGRSGSLGALFFLLSVYACLQIPHNNKWFYCSLFSFSLGLLSYESTWIMPLVAFCVLQWQHADGKISRNTLRLSLLGFVMVFMVYLCLRSYWTGQIFNAYDAAAFTQFQWLALIKNWCRLFMRTWLPPMYQTSWLIAAAIIVMAIFAILFQLLQRKKQKVRLQVYLFGLYMVSYLPYLSLGIDTHGVEGERFLYLPSFFALLWLVCMLQQLFIDKVFKMLIVCLAILSVVFLLQSRRYYVKASSIAQTTLQNIQQQAMSKQKVFIENLPQACKGAVVFRNGLQEALDWQYPELSTKVVVLSTDASDLLPVQHFTKNFKVVPHPPKSATVPIKAILVKDSTYRATYKTINTSLLYNPTIDAWFSFTDTALHIY